MSKLLQEAYAFISKHKLFSKKDKLLVAVSGGVDSLVLAHVLKSLEYNIEIAHCNFGLRGVESDEDEQFVKAWSHSNDLLCHTQSFETSSYAENNKVSIQMAARSLRYEWFEQVLNKTSSNLLATAHHTEDQTETILFNWTKGTGIKGLRGILAKSNHIVRPLLFASKQEIKDYAIEHKLSWREDASNTSTKYHRNKLRQLVIPQLQEINPNLHETVARDTIRHRALEQLLDQQVEEIRTNYFTSSDTTKELNLHWVDKTSGAIVVLEQLLKDYGLNLDQCSSILDGFTKELSGLEFQTTNFTVILDRQRLLIEANSESNVFKTTISEPTVIDISDQIFKLTVTDGAEEIIKNSDIAMLDADKVSFPITVRNWQEGDRFFPLGMKHQKKVSDFMIDAKIPVNLKKRIMIFESNEEIIWLAGYRISEKHKITESTKRSLIIKIEKDA